MNQAGIALENGRENVSLINCGGLAAVLVS